MSNFFPLFVLSIILISYGLFLAKWYYKDRFSGWEILVRSAFFVYILYVLQLIFIDAGWGSACLIEYRLSQIQLVPFSTLSEYFTIQVPIEVSQAMGADMNAHMRGIFTRHAIGNILLFVPFGLLFFLMLPKNISKNRKTLLVIGAIISKELLQLFLLLGGLYFQMCYRGIADIDDVILNAIGFALGYILYKILVKIIPYIKRK